MKAAKGREIEVKGRGVAFARGETADRRVDRIVEQLTKVGVSRDDEEQGGVSCRKEGRIVAVDGGKMRVEVEESAVVLECAKDVKETERAALWKLIQSM